MKESFKVILRAAVEEKLSEWRDGYKSNKSAIDFLFTLKMITEKAWEYNSDTYTSYEHIQAFLDLQKSV